MKVNMISSIPYEKNSFKAEWDSLVGASGNSVFSKFDFVKNWGLSYGDLACPMILLAYEGQDVVGIAPLAIEDQVIKFATGLDYKGVADYCDFIVRPDMIEPVMDEFGKFLIASRNFSLKDIPQTSKNLQYLLSKNIFAIEEGELCSSFPVTDSIETTLANMSKSMRKDLSYYSRRIHNSFSSVIYEVVSDPAKVSDRFSEFVDLHQREWNERGMPGCFAQDERRQRFRKFHEGLARDLLNDGNLYLSFLRCDGKAIGVEYSFMDSNSFYGYLGALDPENKKFGPGKAIMNHVLIDAICSGIKKYDFLRGDEEYKNDYGVTWSRNITLLPKH